MTKLILNLSKNSALSARNNFKKHGKVLGILLVCLAGCIDSDITSKCVTTRCEAPSEKAIGSKPIQYDNPTINTDNFKKQMQASSPALGTKKP